MSRRNNFDVLRLVLASMVVLAHSADLSRAPALAWIGTVISSRVAVEGFFTMSGCLIVASYDRSRSFRSYLEKRARRILPAYWAALLFALALGAAMTRLPLAAFFASAQTWKYVFATLSFATFLHPTLPGVFEANPSLAAVNGALWTIKVEVMFYLLAPVLVHLVRRFGSLRVLGATFVASVCYRVVCERLGHESLALQLPGQLAFFAIGALVHYHPTVLARHRAWWWSVAVMAYLLHIGTGAFGLRVIGIGLVTMCVAFLLPHVEGPTRYGDFSYGIYVFHFPVVQTMVALGVFAPHPYLALASVALCVAAIAVLSWHVVEKRWLRAAPRGPRPGDTGEPALLVS